MIYPQNFEQKIGFDQIRQLLKEKCLSTLGEERVTDMTFSDQHDKVEELLNQVMEFVRIIQEEDSFPDQSRSVRFFFMVVLFVRVVGQRLPAGMRALSVSFVLKPRKHRNKLGQVKFF